jgi:hypothetical protein
MREGKTKLSIAVQPIPFSQVKEGESFSYDTKGTELLILAEGDEGLQVFHLHMSKPVKTPHPDTPVHRVYWE